MSLEKLYKYFKLENSGKTGGNINRFILNFGHGYIRAQSS
jgi:hypothetical protein